MFTEDNMKFAITMKGRKRWEVGGKWLKDTERS